MSLQASKIFFCGLYLQWLFFLHINAIFSKSNHPINLHPDIQFTRSTWNFLRVWNFRKYWVASSPYLFRVWTIFFLVHASENYNLEMKRPGCLFSFGVKDTFNPTSHTTQLFPGPNTNSSVTDPKQESSA